PIPQWYKQTSYDAAGLPCRTRFFGRDGKGQSNYLQASWQTYDNLHRPLAAKVALDGSGSIAWSLFPSDACTPVSDPLAGTSRSYGTSTTTNDAGKVTTSTDAAGRSSTFTYDSFGRRNSVVQPTNNNHADHVDVTYDDQGREHVVTKYLYDPTSADPHTEVL